MTDQTSHNKKDIKAMVAETLPSEHVPLHLFCNVHPSLMFNCEVTNLWVDIENTIGKDKIYSKCLVNATTSHNSVTEQALDCTTRLINHDFNHKTWNRADDFDLFIAPRKNFAVNLKDERFDRLTSTCAVVIYHLDDVTMYLGKYSEVTNQLACIVNCFLNLDFQKVLYLIEAVIGLHFVELFLSVTTSNTTKYFKLIDIFKSLNNDLLEIDSSNFLKL